MALFGVAPQIRTDHRAEFPDWLSVENARVAGETLLSVAGDTFSTMGVPLASSVLSELVPGLAGPLKLALPALGLVGNTALKSASQLVGAGDFTLSSTAFQSLQTQLSHLLGTGIAFGAKGLFKSGLAGIFAQEMGFSFLLNPFLEISGNLFNGASFSEALSQVSKRFSFSEALTWTAFGVAGTAREIFIRNPLVRLGLEMMQRGLEVCYQFKDSTEPVSTAEYVRAFSRGLFSRVMNGTLHAYKLTASQRGLQRRLSETRAGQSIMRAGRAVAEEARGMAQVLREDVGWDGLLGAVAPVGMARGAGKIPITQIHTSLSRNAFTHDDFADLMKGQSNYNRFWENLPGDLAKHGLNAKEGFVVTARSGKDEISALHFGPHNLEIPNNPNQIGFRVRYIKNNSGQFIPTVTEIGSGRKPVLLAHMLDGPFHFAGEIKEDAFHTLLEHGLMRGYEYKGTGWEPVTAQQGCEILNLDGMKEVQIKIATKHPEIKGKEYSVRFWPRNKKDNQGNDLYSFELAKAGSPFSRTTRVMYVDVKLSGPRSPVLITDMDPGMDDPFFYHLCGQIGEKKLDIPKKLAPVVAASYMERQYLGEMGLTKAGAIWVGKPTTQHLLETMKDFDFEQRRQSPFMQALLEKGDILLSFEGNKMIGNDLNAPRFSATYDNRETPPLFTEPSDQDFRVTFRFSKMATTAHDAGNNNASHIVLASAGHNNTINWEQTGKDNPHFAKSARDATLAYNFFDELGFNRSNNSFLDTLSERVFIEALKSEKLIATTKLPVFKSLTDENPTHQFVTTFDRNGKGEIEHAMVYPAGHSGTQDHIVMTWEISRNPFSPPVLSLLDTKVAGAQGIRTTKQDPYVKAVSENKYLDMKTNWERKLAGLTNLGDLSADTQAREAFNGLVRKTALERDKMNWQTDPDRIVVVYRRGENTGLHLSSQVVFARLLVLNDMRNHKVDFRATYVQLNDDHTLRIVEMSNSPAYNSDLTQTLKEAGWVS